MSESQFFLGFFVQGLMCLGSVCQGLMYLRFSFVCGCTMHLYEASFAIHIYDVRGWSMLELK